MATAKTKTTTEKKASKPKTPKKAAGKEGVQTHGEFTIVKKRKLNRYEVIGPNGKNVNGDAKTKVLKDANLIKVLKPKAKTEGEAPKAE